MEQVRLSGSMMPRVLVSSPAKRALMCSCISATFRTAVSSPGRRPAGAVRRCRLAQGRQGSECREALSSHLLSGAGPGTPEPAFLFRRLPFELFLGLDCGIEILTIEETSGVKLELMN